MLETLARAAVIGLFVVAVAFLGFVLLTSLFPSDNPTDDRNGAQVEHSQDQSPDKHTSIALQKGSADEKIATYTLALAVFTALLVIISAFQISFLLSADRTTRRVANSAEESAQISKEALVTVQRAFVFINAFDTYVINDALRIMPKWENSGATPAIPFRNYVNWRASPGELSADFDYPDIDKDGQPLPTKGNGVIIFVGPRATQYADFLIIPIGMMENVRAGKTRLFIWGWADYNDVFSPTPHRTEFCNEVVVTDMGKNETTGAVTVSVSFPIYGPHNTAK